MQKVRHFGRPVSYIPDISSLSKRKFMASRQDRVLSAPTCPHGCSGFSRATCDYIECAPTQSANGADALDVPAPRHGKSFLLRSVAGLTPLAGGSVEWVGGAPPRANFVFQDPAKRKVKTKLRDDRMPATAPNECWSMDFLSDSLFDGREIRVPSIVATSPACHPRWTYGRATAVLTWWRRSNASLRFMVSPNTFAWTALSSSREISIYEPTSMMWCWTSAGSLQTYRQCVRGGVQWPRGPNASMPTGS
ncbi:hypothetical protein SAMN03159340_04012 [Sphingomonas sp. NFR15]|nr:hypothetical protein SAMN03159340_04012 [Sphingomonas sp. NFR15]